MSKCSYNWCKGTQTIEIFGESDSRKVLQKFLILLGNKDIEITSNPEYESCNFGEYPDLGRVWHINFVRQNEDVSEFRYTIKIKSPDGTQFKTLEMYIANSDGVFEKIQQENCLQKQV
jgi:hypothetical protein